MAIKTQSVILSLNWLVNGCYRQVNNYSKKIPSNNTIEWCEIDLPVYISCDLNKYMHIVWQIYLNK